MAKTACIEMQAYEEDAANIRNVAWKTKNNEAGIAQMDQANKVIKWQEGSSGLTFINQLKKSPREDLRPGFR